MAVPVECFGYEQLILSGHIRAREKWGRIERDPKIYSYEAEFETSIVSRDPSRPNLICRVKGEGKAPPFLMYGHVDVVGTTGQTWQVPPFEGRLENGFVWGRGAIDMKGPLTMMLSALLRLKAEGRTPPADIVFAGLSDEESGSEYGAKYLVENHPSLFEGVRYAIGEFGATSVYFGNMRLYPIMVSEKHLCFLKASIKGAPGHGALYHEDGSMAKLAQFLAGLDRGGLPPHITQAAKLMVTELAKVIPFPLGPVSRLLLVPSTTDLALKLMGDQGRLFAPLFHNNVNATIIRGGDKANMVPAQIEVVLDCRLLPGYGMKDVTKEIREVTGVDAEFEVLLEEPDHHSPDMGLFPTLAGVLEQCDPGGRVFPILFSAITDGRWFNKLGIQTYGFTPMLLPRGFSFASLAHGCDERIPAEALDFGADAIYTLLQRLA